MELFECGVCFMQYEEMENERKPYVIGCGHTFCLRCLRQLKDKRCPQCRVQYDINKISPNYILINVISQNKTNKKELTREEIEKFRQNLKKAEDFIEKVKENHERNKELKKQIEDLINRDVNEISSKYDKMINELMMKKQEEITSVKERFSQPLLKCETVEELYSKNKFQSKQQILNLLKEKPLNQIEQIDVYKPFEIIDENALIELEHSVKTANNLFNQSNIADSIPNQEDLIIHEPIIKNYNIDGFNGFNYQNTLIHNNNLGRVLTQNFSQFEPIKKSNTFQMPQISSSFDSYGFPKMNQNPINIPKNNFLKINGGATKIIIDIEILQHNRLGRVIPVDSFDNNYSIVGNMITRKSNLSNAFIGSKKTLNSNRGLHEFYVCITKTSCFNIDIGFIANNQINYFMLFNLGRCIFSSKFGDRKLNDFKLSEGDVVTVGVNLDENYFYLNIGMDYVNEVCQVPMYNEHKLNLIPIIRLYDVGDCVTLY